MLDMKKINESLNRQINGKLSAIVIGIVAVIFPLYALHDTDWKDMEFGFLSILLPLLYMSAITGLIFLALGKQGPQITSKETDHKIAETYQKTQKYLVLVWCVITIAWVVWVGCLFWKAYAAGT